MFDFPPEDYTPEQYQTFTQAQKYYLQLRRRGGLSAERAAEAVTNSQQEMANIKKYGQLDAPK